MQCTLFQMGGSYECSVPFSKGERVAYLFPRGAIAREDAVQHTFCERMLMYMAPQHIFSKRKVRIAR